MSKSIVVLSINTVVGPYTKYVAPDRILTKDEFHRRRRALLDDFGLKPDKLEYIKVPTSDKRWPRFMEALELLRAEGGLKLGSAWVVEPPPRAETEGVWFQLHPACEFKSPTRVRAGSHFAQRDFDYFASDALLDVVRGAGLSGLECLPPANPAHAGAGWSEVFATHPVGRGLDHPLLDHAKHETRLAKNNWFAGHRYGEPTVWLNDIRSDVVIEDVVVRWLVERRAPYFRVEGQPRLVREHLPPTDFAYSNWGRCADGAPGGAGRPFREIICNGRARESLIGAGVMKTSQFSPRAVVAAADAVSAVLDVLVPGPLPLPVYTPAEAAAERSRREQAGVRHGTTTRELTFASADEAGQYLISRLAAGSLPWRPARDSVKFDRIESADLFGRAPAAWRRLAPLLPMSLELKATGADEAFHFEMQLPAWNHWLGHSEPGEDPEDEPSDDDLVVAATPFGDWYALRASDPLQPHDARVVLWDHETTTVADEWPTVAAFVAHLVARCNRHPD